jgi:hypothetical protein
LLAGRHARKTKTELSQLSPATIRSFVRISRREPRD